MKIVLADQSAPEVIRELGGKLFVRTDPHRCCGGGITYLVTASEPEPGRTYRRFDADGFELFLDAGGEGSARRAPPGRQGSAHETRPGLLERLPLRDVILSS